MDNPVYQFLLLARLMEGCMALIIETGQYLLQFIDGIMPDSMAQILGVVSRRGKCDENT